MNILGDKTIKNVYVPKEAQKEKSRQFNNNV